MTFVLKLLPLVILVGCVQREYSQFRTEEENLIRVKQLYESYRTLMWWRRRQSNTENKLLINKFYIYVSKYAPCLILSGGTDLFS
jgi:hypothetical protein